MKFIREYSVKYPVLNILHQNSLWRMVESIRQQTKNYERRKIGQSLTRSTIVWFFSGKVFHGSSSEMAVMLNNISQFYRQRNNRRGLERQSAHGKSSGHCAGMTKVQALNKRQCHLAGDFSKLAESVAHHKAGRRFRPRLRCLKVA